MNIPLSKSSRRSFFLKVILPSILGVVLFVISFFAFIIPTFENNIMDRKREMIRELTNSAWSVLLKYEKEEKDSTMSREKAQQKAIAEIRELRYGEEMKDYFWITDMHPNMIVHPYRRDLEGQSLNDFKDAHGKKLFVEFVKVVQQDDQGYVDYMWQWKDDSLHIVPKLSFVKLFKPWGWIIGTGIYIEDVKKEISSLTKKLIWISAGIAVLIALLLLFISQQSLKIERKRIEAENELHESKEKYRTLVEAATEGLIMLINGHISFANNIITKITGYENIELNNRPLIEIISENNSPDIIQSLSKKIVREGQFELNLKKKSGGFVEVLFTTSTPVFASEVVNIITVKDITIDRSSNLSILDYQRLLSALTIGFFRARIDYKGRFVFANDTTLRILGYQNFRELSEISILELLASSEDRKTLRNILLEKGYVKNKVVTIHKNKNEDVFVRVTLVLLHSENSKEMICDGIIEDITPQEKEKTDIKNLVTRLYSNNFMMEQTVKQYLTGVVTLDAEATITDAVVTVAKRKTDSLLLTKNNSDVLGIITNSDIQQRVLALGLQLDNPAYLIMSAPVITVTENTSLYDAVRICEEHKIHHLVVKSSTGELSGMLKVQDIYFALKNSLSFHVYNISKAETIAALKSCYKDIQLQIKPLINSELSVRHITNLTSAFSDSVIRRIINLTIEEMGPPPVDFSFICLGSEGRQEETLFTDQDNAIIYDNVPKEKEVAINEYFLKLGTRVCDALNQIGYAYCKGNVMAKTPQWCKPITEWENYFSKWITAPEPQNLLDATIFFDLRNIYGNESFVERLRETIKNSVNDPFLYHLATNTYNARPQQISQMNIIPDKNADLLDLKHAVNIIIMLARIYSLQHNISATNTFERLNALREKKVVSGSTIDEIGYVYNFLMKLRFRNQAELSDQGLPLSNIINTKKLMEIELLLLKKSLSSIQLYQQKIGVDFRISS